MTSIRTLLNLFEQEIDPSKVTVDSNDIDPSKVTSVTPPGSTPPATRKWGAGVVGTGSSGPEVEKVQKIVGVTPDKQFGSETKAAVLKAQQKLGVKADGAWGPVTQAAYDKWLASNPGKTLLGAETVSAAPATSSTTPAAPAAANDASAASAASASSTETPDQVYDRREKEKAQKAAAEIIKSRTVSHWQVPPGQTIIGKEDGVIYWADRTRQGEAGSTSGRPMSMDMYNKGYNFADKPLKDAIAALGLQVVPYKKPAGGYAPDGSAHITDATSAPTPASTAPASTAPASAPSTLQTTESIGFQPEELSRIVSLVHYR
jgi:peptidoglycan hydrolase-like protein with peptidoglycan-binding domain